MQVGARIAKKKREHAHHVAAPTKQLTVVDHNFGYVANRFMEYLGVSTTSYGLLSKERMDKRKITPRKTARKKQKPESPGPEYMPGNF